MIAAPKVLQALGCHSFSKEGFEADDLMASLGRWARNRSANLTIMLTFDVLHDLTMTGCDVVEV